MVGDVGGEAAQGGGGPARVEVEHGDVRSALGEQQGGGEADAGGTAGDEGAEPGEFGRHARASVFSAVQNAPCG
ncbi:hypothetical protein STANM309S_05163 [Streptomyces tanashiensis]